MSASAAGTNIFHPKLVAQSSVIDIGEVNRRFYDPATGLANPFLEYPGHSFFLDAALVRELGLEGILKIAGLQIFSLVLYNNPVWSFKGPGAFLDLWYHKDQSRTHGAWTGTHGNKGAAMAIWARELGIKLHAVVPRGTDPDKVRLMEDLRAHVIEHGDIYRDAVAFAASEAVRTGGYFRDELGKELVTCGAGLFGFEMEKGAVSENIPLDGDTHLIVPTGGGWLLAGQIIALHGKHPNLKYVGVHPANVAGNPPVMEGTAVEHLGKLPQQLLSQLGATQVSYVDDVTDEEAQIGLYLYSRVNRTLEGAAASALAPLLRYPGQFAGKKVILYLTGNSMTHREYTAAVKLGKLYWAGTAS